MQMSFDLGVSRSGAPSVVRQPDTGTSGPVGTDLASDAAERPVIRPGRRGAGGTNDALPQGFEGWLNYVSQSQCLPTVGAAAFHCGAQQLPAAADPNTPASSLPLTQPPASMSDGSLMSGESTQVVNGFNTAAGTKPVMEASEIPPASVMTTDTDGRNASADGELYAPTSSTSAATDRDEAKLLAKLGHFLQDTTPHRSEGQMPAQGGPSGDLQSMAVQVGPPPGAERITHESAATGASAAIVAQNRSAQHRDLRAAEVKIAASSEQAGTNENSAATKEAFTGAVDFPAGAGSFEFQAHELSLADHRGGLLSNGEPDQRARHHEFHESSAAPKSAQWSGWVGDAEWRTVRNEAAGPVREPLSISSQIARELVSRAEDVVQKGRTEFSMRLEPPELGTVRVHLSATDNAISARLTVANESVRHIVESQLSNLRQSLADAGMSLQRFDISHGGQGGGHGQSHPEAWHAMVPQDETWKMRTPRVPRVNSNPVARGRIDVMV